MQCERSTHMDETPEQIAVAEAAAAAEAEETAAAEAVAAEAARLAAEGGKEMVKIGEKEYEKGTPEYIEALEKVHTDYNALLPEYTKKTQTLAEIEKANVAKATAEGTPKFLQEGWQPKTWAEIREALKEAADYGTKQALGTLSQKEQTIAEAQKQVEGFVSDIMKENADFNQEDFFSYIGRHSLRADTINDLKAAYSVYKETNKPGAPAEPGKKGGSVASPAGGGEKLPYDPVEIRNQGGGILDKARAAFRSFAPK